MGPNCAYSVQWEVFYILNFILNSIEFEIIECFNLINESQSHNGVQTWKVDFLQKFPGKYLEDNFPGIPTYKPNLFHWRTWCNAPNLVQMAQGGCEVWVWQLYIWTLWLIWTLKYLMQKDIQNVFEISFYLGSFVWCSVAHERHLSLMWGLRVLLWHITDNVIFWWPRFLDIMTLLNYKKIVADSLVNFVFVGSKHLGRNI